MLIGELAQAVGLPSQTIRFYERKGLLPAPARGANGYRTYDEATLVRLRFVQTAQAAGSTLAEIGTIIDLRDDGNVPRAHVATLIHSKLEDVRGRLRDLAALETELDALIERSHRLETPTTATTPTSATSSPHRSSSPHRHIVTVAHPLSGLVVEEPPSGSGTPDTGTSCRWGACGPSATFLTCPRPAPSGPLACRGALCARQSLWH